MTTKQQLVARLLKEGKITAEETAILMTEVQPVYIPMCSTVLGPGNNPYPLTVTYTGTTSNTGSYIGPNGIQCPDNMKIPATT